MTNEEAIKILEFMKSEMLLGFDHDRKEALKLAISALQTQELNNSNQEVKKSSDKLIKASDAVDIVAKHSALYGDGEVSTDKGETLLYGIMSEIMNLPPAQPEQTRTQMSLANCISRQALELCAMIEDDGR